VIAQGGATIGEKTVEANATDSLTVNVEADKSVYIYSELGSLNIYGINYTPDAAETATATATAAPTATATATAAAAATATATTAATSNPANEPMESDITPITGSGKFVMDNYSGKTYTETTLLTESLKLYADSSNSVIVDGSNKTFDDVKYTTRLKMGGAGKFSGTTPTARVLEILPKNEGTILVYFAHASSSGDDRALAAVQNGEEIGEQTVTPGGMATLEVAVKGGSSVYIYGKAGVNVYAIIYDIAEDATPEPTLDPGATPGPTATPDPDAGLSTNEKAVKADAAALEINSISQTAVYFDLDLPMTGSVNRSSITWESSDPDYINIQMVSSPEELDRSCNAS
jgi:ribosomal protein L12E/L44/L45/RPP1/RPP2